jgi:hypothetical protein
MGIRLYVNNWASTLNGSILAGDLSIIITDATGLPTITGTDYYYLTIDDGSNIEIVKVTARTGTTLTVVRGQEGTTPAGFADLTTIDMRNTAESYTEKVTGPASSTDNAAARYNR